jgi:hypothetical protein
MPNERRVLAPSGTRNARYDMNREPEGSVVILELNPLNKMILIIFQN